MSHANAELTPRARLRLARLIVDDGWTISTAAKMFMVSWPTAKRWSSRYRKRGAGPFITPHTSPSRTPEHVVRQIVTLRWRKRLGPVQIAGRLGIPASTVHAVLVRCRINRLSHIDWVTGEPIRRYEHDHPGSMIHIDVTKFGNIPDGGGHRFVGRQKAATAISVLQRAVAWFAARGITVERVLSDNGAAYKSHAWRDACAELNIKHKRTRPYRPQTNGKIERFHRTLADGWAYARFYDNDATRRAALPAWIHYYNHHRLHSAIGNKPPISRLTNLPGQYS